MAFCTNCGTKLSDDAKFCSSCGIAVLNTKHTKRNTVYEGELHKCPNCGEIINSFESNCPSCGYEVRGAINSDAIQNFVFGLVRAKTQQEKILIIKNFPIPNTKEDILEFLILTSNNLDAPLDDELSYAWQSKMEQAYQKAKLVFRNEKEFSNIKNMYNEACGKLKRKRKHQNNIKNANSFIEEIMPVLPNVVIIMGWLISIFILIPLCGINLNDSHGATKSNGYQILLMLDFIGGAILIPLALRCESSLPRLITLLGLILSIIVLIPLCGKNLSSVGFNSYQPMLICDIICSLVIIVRMLKNKSKNPNVKTVLSGKSFLVAIVCVALLFAIYGIRSITLPTINTSNEIDSSDIGSITASESQNTYYEWPTSGLNQYLPKPETPYGKIITDNESRFNIELFQVSTDQFENYVKACKEKGFTIDITKNDSIFYSHHIDQYSLDIFYWKDKEKMEIYLDAPMEMTEIRWPDSDIVKQIPKPESLIGNISSEKSDYFSVYIANITPEQYTDYVDKCMDKGFTIDYSRSDEVFYAYNKNGYYIWVEKQLFDKMYIRIEVPEKD